MMRLWEGLKRHSSQKRIRYLMFQAAMRIVQLVDHDVATESAVQVALAWLQDNQGNYKIQMYAVKCLQMFALRGRSDLLKHKVSVALSTSHPLSSDVAKRMNETMAVLDSAAAWAKKK